VAPREPSLFPHSPPAAWLPGETVFSLASRYHELAGHRYSETTCLQLFGHRRQGSAHDFPSRLDELATRAEGFLGDAESIIREHTILPYYLVFRPQEAARAAVAAMRGPAIGSMKFSLGLLTSRFRAHHPLKACRACMREDQERWHVAYWHRSHQLPGFWVCPRHREPLLESEVKATGVNRFGWALPSMNQLRSRFEMTPVQETRLVELSEAAERLCALPASAIDLDRLREANLLALQAIGLVSLSGRLKAKPIAESFLRFCSELRVVPEFAALAADEHEAESQVRRLLYPPRTGTHPLRLLVLILWCHGSWGEMLRRYRTARAPRPESDMSCPEPRSVLDNSKGQVLELVSRGCSVSAAAERVGVDHATAAAWAAKNGHVICRRPKRLRGAARRRILRLLRRGESVQAVAARSRFSESTVNRMLSTDPHLYDEWKQAKQHRARKVAREQWTAARRDNPLSGVKAWRILAPAAYAWLYRNDRAWLQLHRNPRRPKASAHSTVRWDERDQALQTAVQSAALKLLERDGRRRLTLSGLCVEIPELRPKLRRLDQMPLTRTALVKVLAH